jgi:diguanylate cyclase (GGDEF)-like protein/PAS domain S-box-containing protein
MISNSKFEEIKASGHLPSPRGAALQVIRLTRKDDVTNQEIAHAIKSDPALSSRVIKVANGLVAYQTRPVASIVDAVTVLGLDMVRQLVLGLSVMDSSRKGACQQFDYQDFWAHSLLTAITAQNLVLHSGIGSTEEVFILGLLGQIGSLALATARAQEYARILGAVAENADAGLVNLERTEFGFDHNQLTQAMLADWGLPQVFQEVALHHEDPRLSSFVEGSRGWHLVNVLHFADFFSRVCLAQEPHRRKMVPRLILISTRLGIEMDALAKLGEKSVREWCEWSKLCGIRAVELPPFAELLEAVPLVPGMLDIEGESPGGAATFYKLRILLVDDDEVILLLLKSLLEKAGHTVVTASNGVEGLGMVEKFMPQLILTDWVMPEMDGIEFCKALRQNAAWRNIYVFILTAQEGVDRLVEAFEAGANDYMTKPVSPKVLVARLRAAQRVVQLQEELEHDRRHLHKFADELAAFNHRLRKSDVSMRAILDNSPYMTWLKDAEGRYVRVNKTYFEFIRQKGIQQIIGKTDFDLWPQELAEKHRVADADVMASRQQQRFEESLLDGGKLHWLQTFKTPVIDENGNVLGTTGFARDITERKQAETDLRVAATAFESQEGIMVTDADMVILRVNRAFIEITGYTAAEAVGQTPRLLKSGRHDAAFYAAMWKSIRHSGSWQGEIWNRRKNGEAYPERLSITAVKGAAGEVTHYVATLHDITERKRAEKQIHDLAFYDMLTQLPNRRLLNDRLDQAMAASKRSGRYGALMFLDMDNFKPLNDMHGHVVGDLLLIEVARRIGSCVRETDTVARFGGDEFMVMLTELDADKAESATQAGIVAEKIRIALAEPYLLAVPQNGNTENTVEHHCTSSIGVVLFIGHEASREDIIKWADLAMYQAKEAGRNLIRFYDSKA